MASVNYDTSLTPVQYKAIAHHYGLDKPAPVQYFIWLKNFIQGHLGTSLVYRQPVIDIIRSRAGASFILMGLSWVLSGLIGFILGTLSAFHQGKLLDRIVRWFSYLQIWFPIGISSPIGTLSQDITLADRIKHLILPVFTLSILGIANVTLHTRTKMMSVLSSEYVLFARARGETEWQIFKNHCLRNAIVPAITLHFSYFGELFGGSVLAEQVFSYPGLGSTLTEAGLKSDTPLLIAIVMIGTLFVFAGNLIADILNSIINPQLRRKV